MSKKGRKFMMNKILFRAIAIIALAIPVFASAAEETRTYIKKGVLHTGNNIRYDLHYVLTETDGKFTIRAKEQELMDSCSRGTTKMEKVPDSDAHIFIADTHFGCPAYGIGFSLDFKNGWTLLPSKSTGKYPTGDFLMKWVSDGNKTPTYTLE